MAVPQVDPASALVFIINAAAGASDEATRRDAIEHALAGSGRKAELLFCHARDMDRVARQAAHTAAQHAGAVIAVGGDGTINTVARAAHAAGCAMGVVAQGTFNYFARTHGIPAAPAEAVRLLLDAVVQPVQVAAINDHLFLVNASVGLYPDLLQDREAFKRRFGRSRWVAFVAGCATLLRAQRSLRMHIELGGTERDIRALTLFVGNNRLQLEQLGAQPEDTVAGTPGAGSIAAVMLRPVGTLAMLRLMLHGALGTLGEHNGVERFEFHQLVLRPTLALGRQRVKVAFDGEVAMLQTPLDFRILARPLYLMQARPPSDPALAIA